MFARLLAFEVLSERVCVSFICINMCHSNCFFAQTWCQGDAGAIEPCRLGNYGVPVVGVGCRVGAARVGRIFLREIGLYWLPYTAPIGAMGLCAGCETGRVERPLMLPAALFG